MSLQLAEVQTLTVLRKTDIGYMLQSGEDQVFLHVNETNHMELLPNQEVSAFLYVDPKGRTAATLNIPYITLSKPGFLKVTSVVPSLGIFLDMGIAKELLLSRDDLPKDHVEWPEIGDELFVTLRIKTKLVAKLATKSDVPKVTEPIPLKTVVEAHIQRIGREGMNLLTKEGHWIFVHKDAYEGIYRLGQKVSIKVIYHSDQGYSGTLKPQKETVIHDDANRILSYVIRHNSMNLTSDSSPEAIEHTFHMSKKAFKRALGHLYKERKIDFVDGKTVLVKPHE